MEERVVVLAARGLTNPQIANELVVSPRTVQGHLYRAFKKLGVKSRAQLVPAWLDRNEIGALESRANRLMGADRPEEKH
jgi:DNA-binding CsgD family transcriptional regulator